ncbi:melanoma-associated antigen 10-like [Castor canadensis]|uniref:Melanoma-associated antigen 10-like n=1 Tax=Castor canadensis TaxID=51338 RepID=A0AC58LRE1_CASCN
MEEEEVPASGILNTPQVPLQSLQSSCSSSTPQSKLDEKPRSQDDEDPESLLRHVLDKKVAELVQFLLLKYQSNELITKEEVLNIVKDYKDHFPAVFEKAHDFTELVFGIAVTRVDPNNHSYIIYNTLEFTYYEMLSDDQDTPKSGLLILILSIIFMEENCAPEEKIWEVLNAMEVYAGREHFIYGDPRKLITEDWVQKKYLECQEVPNSDLACYRFLWGPRAHVEINKKKILEFLAKLKDVVSRYFPAWYKNALKDVEERSQAILDAADNAEAMSGAFSSVVLPCLEIFQSLKRAVKVLSNGGLQWG